MLNELKKTLIESPVVKKGDYDYFVHPITDGVPVVYPELLNDIINYIVDNYDLSNIDKIVCIEAMGIPLATALSLKTDIPFVVIRKRMYNLKGEYKVHQETGYSENELYINGISSSDNILIIDDVVSTGGTLISILKAFDDIGVNIKYIMLPIEKGDGCKIVEKETGHKLDTFVKIKMVEGKVTILDE